ncbi:MAG: SDR family NAD(P)-dependent oxidoreductase [Xanthobacteraceae bacterium]
MKRRPDLPPRPRGRPARRLTSAAARGAFELPVCQDCGAVQYPVREVCVSCLSDNLRWEKAAADGTVLSVTAIRHATDPYFQARRPLAMGSVKLDTGPVVIARFPLGDVKSGDRVEIRNELDRSGEAILVATPARSKTKEAVLSDPNREIAGKVVLITGADGGIGRALVRAFGDAGAKQVIAAARKPAEATAADTVVHRLTLDVTSAASIEAAVSAVGPSVDILINNAGVTASSSFLDADTMGGARNEMEVNYFGTLALTRALAPHLKAKKQGVIVNVLTVLAHSCLPSMGSYCASKAATLSLTQGIRAELLPWGIRVCAIFPTTVDTPASADSPPPKLSPQQVAAGVVKMIQDGVEDAYPGSIASDLAAALRADPKAVEREMSVALPEPR